MKKKSQEKKEVEEKDNSYWIAIGMCLGISIGTAIGAATNNIGLWMPIGLGFGLCLGAAFSNSRDNNKK